MVKKMVAVHILLLFLVISGYAYEVSETCSYIAVSPITARANGTDTITVLVTIKSETGIPVSGETVVLNVTRPESTIIENTSPPDALTNASGQCSFTIRSSYSYGETITATVAQRTIKENLLGARNPCFEEGPGDTSPTGWGFGNWGTGASGYWDTTTFHTGLKSLKIINPGGRGIWITWPGKKGTMTENTSYKLSVWVIHLYTSGSNPSFIVFYNDINDTNIGSSSIPITPSDTWTYYSSIVTSPAKTDNIRAIYLESSSGAEQTVWFDDVRIERIPTVNFTASNLKFVSSPFTIIQNEVSPKITVIAGDSYGNTDTTFNNTVALLSSSSNGKFSSDGTNWSTINDSAITLISGASNFYYKDTNIGTPTITISRTGLVSDVQQETITENTGAMKLAIVTPSRNINAGDISDSICVQAWTINNAPDITYSGTGTFSSSSGAGKFASSLSTETWTSTVIFNMINGETWVYYKDFKSGSPTIAVTSGTLENTSQLQSVTTGSLNKVSSYITLNTYTIKADGTILCTAIVTVCDTFGNPLTNKLVTLQSARGAQDTITTIVGTTDASGKCTFTIKSSYAGLDTLVAVVSDYPNDTITKGINKQGAVGIWNFDDWSNVTLDISGYGNTGTLLPASNPPIYISGKYGSALQFDGANDYVDISHSNSLNCTQTISLEAWLYTDVAQNGKFLVEKGTSTYLWGLYLSASSTSLIIYISSIGTVNTTSTTDTFIGNWRHTVGTFDGRYIKLYVNGELKNIYDWGSQQTIASNTESVIIGSWKSGGTYFNGLIDEVRIYNRALSEEEIKSNYKAKANIYFTATNLKFVSSPFSTPQNTPSPKITAIAGDNYGNTDTTFNNTITITSSSTEGQFSSDGANWSTSNDSSITFVSGVGNFYYKDTNIGTPTITVSRTGLVSDIQQETITENPNAIKLAIVTPSRNINAGDISDSICVQAWTINNIKASSYNGTCTFSTTSGAGRFCVTQTGETWTSSIILNMITGETYVYYKDTRAGSPVITVTSGTLENTSQVQSVSPLSFNNTSSYITFTPYTIKADGTSLCTAVVTICDTYGNPLPGKTVSLSTPRGTKDEITKLLPEDGVTNTNGQCSFTISSSYSGQDTITAVVSGYPGNTISRGVNKEGAVGIWHFDDGNSITLDASGYNNTGTLTNGPVYLSGKYGKALQFDGVDDYIDCGNNQSLNCTSQITIEAWVKRVDPDHNDYILCKNNAYMFEFQESGSTYYFRFRVYDGGWKFAWSNNINSISQTEWNHYAVRFKRPNVYFYVNGKPWGTPTLDNTPALSSDSVTIGALKTASTIYSSKGSIDEVKLYNRLLTSEEIKASYDARANVYFTSYKLNFTPSPFKAKAGTSIPLMVTFGGAAGVDNSFNDTALLESSSDSGQFSANGSSWNGTNTMIVKLVSGETQVYYKDLKLGTPTLTVSRGSEYESSSQIETITAGRIEFISPQFTIHSNETVSIRIIASDYAGNTDTNWSETVQFSSNSSRCKFSATDGDYNDTTIVLRMVQGETSCYLKNTRGGIWTITAKSYDYTWTIDKDTPVTGAQANTITQPIISVTKYHQKKNITYNTSSIPVTTGETISYKLSITNLGSETATNLIITDTYVFDTSVNNAISLNDWDTTSWFSSGDSYTYTIDPQGIDWQPWGSEPPSLPANNIKGLRWKINLLGIYEENKTKNIYFEIKK